MLVKRLTESAQLRLVVLFWAMALHSFVIGLLLIFHPADMISFFGYKSINEQFFPVQGGVFHVLMAVLYTLTAMQWEHLKCLVYFSVIVKSTAVVFLFSYYVFADGIPILIVLGICDGAMAVLIVLSAKSLRKEMLKTLITVPGET
jgi:hypothetical protein